MSNVHNLPVNELINERTKIQDGPMSGTERPSKNTMYTGFIMGTEPFTSYL